MKVAKDFLKYAAPFVVAMLMQAIFNIVDVTYVGFMYNSEVVSSVGAGGQLAYLLVNTASGISVGAGIYFGQIGVSDREKIGGAIGAATVLFAMVATLGVALILGLCSAIPTLMNTPKSTMDECVLYGRILAAGLPFVMGYNLITGIMKGYDDGGFQLIPMAVALALNVLLKWILGGICRLGFWMIPTTTVISEAVACVVSGVICVKKLSVRGMPHIKYNKDTIGSDLKGIALSGLPIGAISFTAGMSFIFLTARVGRLYEEEKTMLALHALAIRLNGFSTLPARAVGSGVSVFYALLRNSKPNTRISKLGIIGILTSLFIEIAPMVGMLCFPEQILDIFGYSGDEGLGVTYLKIISAENLLVPIYSVIFGLIEGSGKAYVTMGISIFADLFVRILLGYLLGDRLGIIGIALSIPAASLVCLILGIAFYFIFKERTHVRLNA